MRNTLTKQDPDSVLLIELFKKATKDAPVDAADFIDYFEYSIYETCRVMKLLRLVEESSSALGYKPTPRLIEIVLDHLGESNAYKPLETMYPNCFVWLWQVGTDGMEGHNKEKTQDAEQDDDSDDLYGEAKGFCRRVFLLLGLLKQDKGDQYLPTQLMIDLLNLEKLAIKD
jgi:hypothetical protein